MKNTLFALAIITAMTVNTGTLDRKLSLQKPTSPPRSFTVTPEFQKGEWCKPDSDVISIEILVAAVLEKIRQSDISLSHFNNASATRMPKIEDVD